MSDLVISVTLIINADHCMIDSAAEMGINHKDSSSTMVQCSAPDRGVLMPRILSTELFLKFGVPFVVTASIPVQVLKHHKQNGVYDITLR